MCGIFGFALKKPTSTARALNLLKRLEVHRYESLEETPVGGYGAGIAVLLPDGEIILEKVGKTDDSPAKALSEIVEVHEASAMLGHVRMPSPEFMNTSKYRETAQPYIDRVDPELTIVSVHNGKVQNYKQLREELGKAHVLESEKVELIDSEVIPHYFEKLLNEEDGVDAAVYALFCALQGSNAIAILHVNEEETYLHLLHRGKTRGLIVWANERNEVFFCSRKEPLLEEYGKMLVDGKFREKILIPCKQDAGLKLSFQLP
jgi:glucosamine 6-phosphate synthetase-like amidotransferase/phosphosugar isomerase protein